MQRGTSLVIECISERIHLTTSSKLQKTYTGHARKVGVHHVVPRYLSLTNERQPGRKNFMHYSIPKRTCGGRPNELAFLPPWIFAASISFRRHFIQLMLQHQRVLHHVSLNSAFYQCFPFHITCSHDFAKLMYITSLVDGECTPVQKHHLRVQNFLQKDNKKINEVRMKFFRLNAVDRSAENK
uniref:Uncharacterized protein n=1 Tax=Ascaris lumbricoides TaxID=6252 RepID=A0A0M3HWH8_ASCLU